MTAPRDIIALWDQGVLGRSEFVTRFIECITRDSVRESVPLLSQELAQEVREKVRTSPTDDEGWSKVLTIFGGSNSPDGEGIEDTSHDFRRGVEVLREFLP